MQEELKFVQNIAIFISCNVWSKSKSSVGQKY